jgi:hypothetical protein
VGLLLVLLISFSNLEPFAPRYQKRTVNQWINDISRLAESAHICEVQSISPRTDVVAYFGLKAVPTLIRPSKLPFWHGSLKKIQIPALQGYLQKQEIRIGIEEAIKRGWMQTYCENNPEFEINSLQKESDAFLLAIFQLNTRRLNLYTNHPDQAVRQRAVALLRKM